MSIPSVRASVWDLVETLYNRYVAVHWNIDREERYPQTIETVFLPQLDNGWFLEKTFENPYYINYFISGTEQETIIYSQCVYNEDIIQNIDNNPISTEQIYLSDTVPVYLYTYSDGTQILLWLDRYTFTMIAEHTSRETLLSLAASVSSQ